MPVVAGEWYGLVIAGCDPVELGLLTSGICEAAGGVTRNVGSDFGSYILGAAGLAPTAEPAFSAGADPPG